MELFQFGFGARPQATTQVGRNLCPGSIIRAETIKVLWSSWCDVVVAYQNGDGSWMVEYRGTGLTSTQSESVANSQDIKDSIRGDSIFFGGLMHEGLLGYVIPRCDRLNIANKVIVFATDLEIESGVLQVQSYTIDNGHEVLDIKVASGGGILVSTKNLVTGEPQILHFQDLPELRQCLRSNSLLYPTQPPLGSFLPMQWCTNAIISTALDQHGKVYTSTCDSRYPKCLGRPYGGNPAFEILPYLSETHVLNIASGGYLTAAVSSDGELFLWGQSCPGTSNDLHILNKSTADRGSHQTEPQSTGIWVEGEQDDFIKCLTAYIDGEEARVYAVAVGHGHIIVAAEGLTPGGNKKRRAVFSAGDNNLCQTGLETVKGFIPEFKELQVCKDEYIQQLVAAGWSTFLVGTNDRPDIE